MPNSTLSVNRSKPVQRTHGVALSLNKLVAFFWEASNEFTTLSSDPDFRAQKNTSWQTEVLIYLSRFSLPRRSSLEQILSHEDAFFRFLFSQADIECCVHIFWHQTFLFCPFLLSTFPHPHLSLFTSNLYVRYDLVWKQSTVFQPKTDMHSLYLWKHSSSLLLKYLLLLKSHLGAKKRFFWNYEDSCDLEQIPVLYRQATDSFLFSFCRHLSNILLFHLNVDSFGRLHPVAVSSQLFGWKSGKWFQWDAKLRWRPLVASLL